LTQDLFRNLAAISTQTSLLSMDITILAPTTDAMILADGIRAVLQLSSDIGEMADRIGEMADNVLIMSDNIGLMADRIIVTQGIQSENMLLTQNTVLQTQTNILALVSVVETASHDLSLDTLIADGNILVAKMALVGFTPWTMDTELENIQTDVNNYLLQIKQFQEIFDTNTSVNKTYINSDTMNTLTNLSVVMTSIGSIMEGYNVSIQFLQVSTSEITLLSSMDSILNLSADIGSMSNTILEMADNILLTADNIGLEADEILITQQLQSANIAMTQISILASQKLAINIIASIN